MPRALIITALPMEYRAVRNYLTDLREVCSASGSIYEIGKFIKDKQDWEVAIVETGVGNATSALETERAIAFFNPEILLLVGVAGGLRDVAIGDVVVATKVYAYEVGRAGKEFSPRSNSVVGSYMIEQRARTEARKSDWLQFLSVPSLPHPKVFLAPIASGDKFVTSTQSELFRFLRSTYSDAVAIDMEGFGLLSVASYHPNIEALVIRGVSDLIDGGKNDDSLKKAVNHASAFAFQVLANIRLEDSSTKSRDSLVQSPPSQFRESTSQRSHPVGQSITLSRYADISTAYLRADEYAEALAKVLNNAKGEVCFAIFGHWGRGKTYLMKLVEYKLSKGQYDCVWFSAWKYRTKPEIWIHLYEILRLKATNGEDILMNLARKFRIFLVKAGSGIIFSYIALLIISLMIPLGVVGVLIIPPILIFGIAYSAKLGMGLFGAWNNLSTFAGLSKKTFKIAEHQEKLGLQEVIGEDLRSLLIGWVGFGRNNKHIKKKIIKFWRKTYFSIYIILVFSLSIVVHSSMGTTNSQLSQLTEFISTFSTNTLYGNEIESILKVILPAAERTLSGLIGSDWVKVIFPAFIVVFLLAPLLCLTHIGLEKSKVLLIVDDLDRLPSKEVLEIIESLKLLLEGDMSELIQVVVICEESFLEKAFCEKYDGAYGIENTNTRKSLIEENVQKLFISHLRLPPINIEEQKEYLSNLIGYRPSDNSGINENGDSVVRSLLETSKSEVSQKLNEPSGNVMTSQTLQSGFKWLIFFLMALKDFAFRFKLTRQLFKTSDKANKKHFSDLTQLPDSRDESKSPENLDIYSNEPLLPSSGTTISEDLEEDEKVALYNSLDQLSEWVTLGPRAIQSFVFRYKLARHLLQARGRKDFNASELAGLLAKRLSGQPLCETEMDEDIKNVLEEVA